jgi:hypothetical protein
LAQIGLKASGSKIQHFIIRWKAGGGGGEPDRSARAGHDDDEAGDPRRVGRLERVQPILSLSKTLEGIRGRN